MSSSTNILDTVVRHGYCCNCGLCAAVCPRRQLQMTETQFGEYHPQACRKGDRHLLPERPRGCCAQKVPVPFTECADSCRLCLEACPFSNEHAEDEDSLGKQLFGSDPSCTHYSSMGWVRDTFVGGISDEAARLESPSGGLTTAVLCELLRLGTIDAAIVLQPVDQRPWHRSVIAANEAEMLAARGSVYHVAPFDQTISAVLSGPERSYAIVALPCQVKALRLAQKRLPALRRRIRYILGLTCSSYRSLLFADLLTALMGRRQGVLRYRSKRGSRTSRDFRAELRSGDRIRSAKLNGLFGYLWVNEVGSLRSCLFCDDVFAELADATFMDAWLPEYRADRRGTNLVIARNAELSELLTALFESRRCEGGRIAPERVEQSQAGLLSRRRRLLAARCEVAAEMTSYVPRKRPLTVASRSDDAEQREARRELAFFEAARNELLRFGKATSQRPVWFARWRAWWFCWRILRLAARHGFLGRILGGAKFFKKEN
jgi:coenzyme F420 hydrogenase subunit beta